MLHKLNNLKIINVIDVGAFVGDFSQSISKSHSEANIFSIEANPNCEAHLKSKSLKYKICCLSDQQKTLNFYIQDDVDVCSGASYYKENTKHYSKSRSIKVNTETLDNLNLFTTLGTKSNFPADTAPEVIIISIFDLSILFIHDLKR